MNCFRTFTVLFSVILVISCTGVPESEFYSAHGIISIRSESLAPSEGWIPHNSALMDSKISVSTLVASRNTLQFDFYVVEPGNYSLWILGSAMEESSDKPIALHILDGDQYLINSMRIKMPISPEPLWYRAATNPGGSEIQFLSEGHYSIQFESGGIPGILLSGIHLSKDGATEPTGTGFPETRDFSTDPVLEKREHHVEIPPAWTFGVFITAAEVSKLPAVLRNLQPDAVWDISNSSKDFLAPVRTGQLIHLEEDSNRRDRVGLSDFKVLKSVRGIEELENFYTQTSLSEDSESRRFHLSEAVGLGNPVMKSYPAMWHNSHLKGFDQLRDQVDMVSNPYRITYEIPFMTGIPVPAKEEVSEELFIRTLQFSAFNTIMVLPMPSAETFNYSDEVLRQIKKFTSLRQQLFPYIYSYTLRARTARIKPLTGDSSYPLQFYLGDAFLSAPITEEGSDQRLVYFPEGTWFNYWDDIGYRGGQSWIVEAPLSGTPLFVKAGSIIPYRSGGGPVSDTDNATLYLDIYTGEPGTFRLYEDDGITTSYKAGEFSTTAFRYFEHEEYSTFTIGAVVRGFEGRRTETEYILRFKFMNEPVSITVNGEEIPRGSETGMWHFNEEERSVVIKWSQPDHIRTEFYFQADRGNPSDH
jgi:hypothetical protein